LYTYRRNHILIALLPGLIFTAAGAGFARNMGTQMRIEQQRVQRQHITNVQRAQDQKEKPAKEPKKPKEKKAVKNKKKADKQKPAAGGTDTGSTKDNGETKGTGTSTSTGEQKDK
jgi:hypothetical protein